jgi:hypothetical protein
MPLLTTTTDSLLPEAPLVPDLSKQERLECLMQQRLGNRVRGLRVLLHPTGMVLEGRAASYYVKQLAQHAAMELADVPILANEIEVK